MKFRRLLTLFASVVWLASMTAHAQESETTSLLDRIIEAQEYLKEVSVNATIDGRGRGAHIHAREVTLAVVDDLEGGIEIIKVNQYDDALKKTPAGWQVKLERSNGVNSRYAVTKIGKRLPYYVLAIKYPLMVDGKREDAIYTPYAPELHTSELIDVCSSYLEGTVLEALFDLEAKNVRSLSHPRATWEDTVEPIFLASLAITEHVDPSAVVRSGVDPVRAIERFFVMLGANRERTFTYSKSSAGALGMMQFIPSTYKLIVRRYAKAELIPDFTRGMRDHKNAVKAAALLTDANLTRVREDKTNTLSDALEREAFLAAAYNGGSTRVLRAVLQYADTWEEDRRKSLVELERRHDVVVNEQQALKRKIKSASARDRVILRKKLATLTEEHNLLDAEIASRKRTSLRRETITYIAKFRLIRNYLADS